MTVTNVYAIHRTNVGDMASSPLLYFPFPFPVGRHSVTAPPRPLGHAIFGGGGLQYFREVGTLCREAAGKLVSWGLGHNTHGTGRAEWPGYMAGFALHGVRDHGTGLPWVPCASCMHPALDRAYPVTREAVVYYHRDRPFAVPGRAAADNALPTMAQAVEFLGSAAVVLTNTYHGAYWGTLLGRRVVIVDPFSSRFYHFRHQPRVANLDDWQSAAATTPTFPEALAECRAANRAHHERVCELLG